MRERESHKVGGWYPQVQGPPQVQDPQGERGQRGQDTQIVNERCYLRYNVTRERPSPSRAGLKRPHPSKQVKIINYITTKTSFS